MTPELLQAITKELTATRDLIYIVIALMLVIGLERLIALGRALRKLIGLRNNGNPGDPVTLDQFNAGTKLCRQTLCETTDRRFNAVDEQLKLSRRKDNTMLIILRDMRAFMIYQRMPDRDLPPMEPEDGGEAI